MALSLTNIGRISTLLSITVFYKKKKHGQIDKAGSLIHLHLTSIDTGCWWLPTWVSCPCHQSTGLYLIYQYPVSELPACFQTVQKIPPLTSKVDRMVPGEPCCPVAQDEILLNCSEKDGKYKCLGKIYCSHRLLWNYISIDTFLENKFNMIIFKLNT